ncbi:MAG: NADH dehydrogenase subunit 6 [Ignavibacteriae bacterium]|nr:NADH dehydrogenase subunit 6 [Ignavibacteriota bacterium]
MAKDDGKAKTPKNEDEKKKDFEKKYKERVQRRKKREQKEMKRIHSIIEFPFKFLFKACLVVGLVFFIFKYFGQSQDLGASLLNAFVIFSASYIGFGAIMMLVLFLVSAAKKEKLRESIKLEREQKRQDDLRRAEEEARLDSQLNSGYREERPIREQIPPPAAAVGTTQQFAQSAENDFITQNIMDEELNTD